MTDATCPAAPTTALDADGEEFTLDFGFPAVAARPVTDTNLDKAGAREAQDRRSAQHRLEWYRERGLVP